MANHLAEATQAIERARDSLASPAGGSFETAQAEAGIASAYALTEVAAALSSISTKLQMIANKP